ncbi:MAG: gliding motility-associated-like protein [Lentimonas sp.]|jgi:gliding motility-associated-like protein
MNRLKKHGLFMALILTLGCTVFTPNQVDAQEFDGTDFWVGFLSTQGDASQVFTLNLISDTIATVIISVPLAATPYTDTVSLLPNVLVEFALPKALVNNNSTENANGTTISRQSHVVRKTGVHITSTANIIVYAGNNQEFSSDAATAIPTSALGTKYEVIAFSAITTNRASTFCIVGTEDNTTISLKYNGWTFAPNLTQKFPKGGTETIILNRGELYTVVAYNATPLLPPEDINNIASDLTGTTINADKPVSVFGGNECATAGECPFCDHLYEQIRPLKSWGYQYNVAPTYKLPVVTSDIVKIYATEDNTQVILSGSLTINLNKLQSYHLDIANPLFIKSNKPIHVSQYLKGSTCNTPRGEIDPLMMDILPENQYTARFLFGASSYGRYGRHYATVIIETGKEGSLRLNGNPVALIAPGVQPIPGSGFSVLYIALSRGKSYILESIIGARMSVYAYGYGIEEAYGYTAGGKILDLCYVQTKDTTVCYNDVALIHGLNLNILTGEEVADNNILWFNTPSGGASVYSGKDVTTASITNTTVLWAQVANETCKNERYKITINGLPELVASIHEDAAICSGDDAEVRFEMQGSSNSFDIVYSDGTSNFNLNDVSSGVVDVQNPLTNTTYSIVSLIDDSMAMCLPRITNEDITISVTEAPVVTNLTRDCNLPETHYSIEFDLQYGDILTYQVKGITGAFDGSGTHFISDPILAGGSYAFDVFDDIGCDTVSISGIYACNCANSSGAMVDIATKIKVCEGNNAIATHDGQEVLVADDRLTFYLHTSSGAFLGTVKDSSLTPEFGFKPGMTYGTTYYISPATGNKYTTSEFVDRSEPCFNIMAGKPVVFFRNPTAQISGNVSICAGETENMIIALTGNGPFDLIYTDGTSDFPLNNINNGHNNPVSPTTTTTYSIKSVQINNGPMCSGTPSGTFTVTVKQSPTLSMTGNISVCPGEEVIIPLNFTGIGPFNISYNSNSLPKTANDIVLGGSLPVTPIGNTTYIPTQIFDQNTGCIGTVNGSYIVDVSSTPVVTNVVEDCNGGDQFTVEFDINGGSGNYTVEGGPGTLTGGTFNSSPMPGGSAYSFDVFDDNNCDTITITGTFSCCDTRAGNMISAALFEICQTSEVSVDHNGGQILEPGDKLQFILCSDLNDPLSSVITVSDSPSFVYISTSMSLETVYYVYAIAGGQNGQGDVDFNDPCFSISAEYNEILFHENPESTILGSEEICIGSNGNVFLTTTSGQGPFNIVYSDGTSNFNLNGVGPNSSFLVSPTSNATYTVVSVSNTETSCSGGGQGTVTITVQNPNATFDIEGDITLDGIVSFVNTTSGANPIQWILPDESLLPGDEVVNFSFSDLGEGLYNACLIVESPTIANCIDTTCKDIEINGDISVFIPNTFTPNGTKFNEEFIPVINGATSIGYSFLIFNRWGGLVFETDDMRNGWNGSLNNNGPTLNTGFYTYVVNVVAESNSEKKVITGNVSLLK